MGIFLDIVVVAILALNIILGYKKGLINVVFNIVAFLLAIVITLVLYKPVSNIIIQNTNIHENIKEMILKRSQGTEPKEENIESNDRNKYIENSINNMTNEAKTAAREVVAENFATKAAQVITGIVLFILTRAILILLRFVTQTIAKLPIIKQFNTLGGIIYGIIKGLIIIYVLLTIMYLIVSIKGNGNIALAIDSSCITKFLYDNNIIVNYCLLGKNLL